MTLLADIFGYLSVILRGFKLIGEHYRETWRRRAPERLRRLAHQPFERKPVAAPGALAHRGDEAPQRTGPPEPS